MRLSDIAGVGGYLANAKGRISSPNGMYYQDFDTNAEATMLGETENHERMFVIAMPNKLYREVLYFPQILIIQYDLKRGCVRKISRIDATMENVVKCLGKLPDDLHFTEVQAESHDLQSWNECHLNKCAKNRYHKL